MFLSVILLISAAVADLPRRRRVLRKRVYDTGTTECPKPCSCRLPHEVSEHCYNYRDGTVVDQFVSRIFDQVFRSKNESKIGLLPV